MIWINDGTPGKCLDVAICIFTCSRTLVMPWSLFSAPLRSRWDPHCAGTKSPAWPPCQPQRGFVLPRVKGRSWNNCKLQLTAFAINTPATAGVSCQGFGRVCHGLSKPHTAAVLLSLPDSSQQVFLAGGQNQQVEGCRWGQDLPRALGFSPLCPLCCDGSTTSLSEATGPASWPMH